MCAFFPRRFYFEFQAYFHAAQFLGIQKRQNGERGKAIAIEGYACVRTITPLILHFGSQLRLHYVEYLTDKCQ